MQVPEHSLLSCLQCLNAVRTVQSLACLEEADHTVGFILQLSHFRKEWHFHLPQLMRDVQVGLGHCFLEGLGRSDLGRESVGLLRELEAVSERGLLALFRLVLPSASEVRLEELRAL